MFGVSELPYLGYIVSREGRKTSPEKVAAVNQAKQPHNLTSLRAFMGLVNYYGVFIPKLATVAPLHGLMKKYRRWSWGDEEEKAWQKIKKLLSSAEVLCHYNPGLPIRLACDASPFGVAAVLSHVMPNGAERTIAYVSKSLSDAEKTILNWTKKP